MSDRFFSTPFLARKLASIHSGLLREMDFCTLYPSLIRDSSPLRNGSIVFFKPKPNLPDAAKARMECHFQQIAECIGFDRMRLPVLRRKTLLGKFESDPSPAEMIRFVGDHLGHPSPEISLRVEPQTAASCSGGG